MKKSLIALLALYVSSFSAHALTYDKYKKLKNGNTEDAINFYTMGVAQGVSVAVDLTATKLIKDSLSCQIKKLQELKKLKHKEPNPYNTKIHHYIDEGYKQFLIKMSKKHSAAEVIKIADESEISVFFVFGMQAKQCK